MRKIIAYARSKLGVNCWSTLLADFTPSCMTRPRKPNPGGGKLTPRHRRAKRQDTTSTVRSNGAIRFKKKRVFSAGEVVEFEEEDWQKISRSLPLPLAADARFRIGAAIATYRNESFANRTSLKTKRLVEQMRGYASKLVKGANELTNDLVFLNAGLPWWKSRTGPSAGDILNQIQKIQALDQILADAQDRMKVGPGRKSAQPLEHLIKQLVWIQAEVTQKYVTRSIKTGVRARPTNRFIELCVHFADRRITSSNIERVLTRCIAEHHDTLAQYGFDTATGQHVNGAS
jgi:hypothetical protein